MRVWRLSRPMFVRLDGEGARLYGGRWNSEGLAVVYAAEHLSLAVLENLVHYRADLLPEGLVAVAIDVPDGVATTELTERDLPNGWTKPAARHKLRDIGDRWLAGARTVALLLPSAVVPQERNLLLNPRHADMARVRAGAPQPFAIDPRLLG